MKNWGDYPCSIFEVVSSHGTSVAQRNAESLIYMFSAVWAKGGWIGKVTQESLQNRQEDRPNTDGIQTPEGCVPVSAPLPSLLNRLTSVHNYQKTFPHISQSTERLKMKSNISNFTSPGWKCSLFLTTYKGRGDIIWLSKHWGWSIWLYQLILQTCGQSLKSCTTYGSAHEQDLAKKVLKQHLIPGHSVSGDWMKVNTDLVCKVLLVVKDDWSAA